MTDVNQMIDQYKNRIKQAPPKDAKLRTLSNADLTNAVHRLAAIVGALSNKIEGRNVPLYETVNEVSLTLQGIMKCLDDGKIISYADMDANKEVFKDLMREEIENNYDRKHGLTVVDRAVENGDAVIISYEVFALDGTKHEGFGAKRYFVNKIGDGELIPEVEVALLGMKAGEAKELAAKLPEDADKYREFSGQDVKFQILLCRVKEHKQAENQTKEETPQ